MLHGDANVFNDNSTFCNTSGDLGGLLGLFLGGSAISVFEIVDLVVYNLALQLLGYVVKRPTAVADGDSQPTIAQHQSSAQLLDTDTAFYTKSSAFKHSHNDYSHVTRV